MTKVLVYKNQTKPEKFSEKKLRKSIVKACLINERTPGQSELYAKKVMTEFKKWLSDKQEITSEDISQKIAEILQQLDPETSNYYKNFKEIL